MKNAVKITNLHGKVRFCDLVELVELFGEIRGFYADNDGFVFGFKSFPGKLINMNGFPLAHRRMKVEAIEWNQPLDEFRCGNIILFKTEGLEVDELRDECSMFGCVVKVIRNEDGGISVVCKREIDGEKIFGNMYGRLYNGKRLRCFVVDDAIVS